MNYSIKLTWSYGAYDRITAEKELIVCDKAQVKETVEQFLSEIAKHYACHPDDQGHRQYPTLDSLAIRPIGEPEYLDWQEYNEFLQRQIKNPT